MAKRMCNYPRCTALVTRATYCDKHRQEIANDYNANVRGDEQSLYNSNVWKKVRRNKIVNSPLCELCAIQNVLVEATIVHHIVPVKDDWSKRLDMDNLQSLCHTCHENIHAQQHVKTRTTGGTARTTPRGTPRPG